MLTFEQIKELIELVARHRLIGVEVDRSGFRLKIDGFPAAIATGATPASPQVSPPAALSEGAAFGPLPAAPAMQRTGGAAAAAAGAGTSASAPPGTHAESAAKPPQHLLYSPIVGTFYRAPSPDAPVFVEVGSRVKKGQVVCIIEAMKLMNEIESDIDGVIAEICPQNAQAVEFGEPLFAIVP